MPPARAVAPLEPPAISAEVALLSRGSSSNATASTGARVGANQICSAALSSPIVQHLSRRRGLWTWKAHEGSFYPLAWVLEFGAVLDSWAQANRFNVLAATPMPEEFWLPIWVLNEKAETSAEASGPQVAMRGPEDCDYCISREAVDGIRTNGGPYFGVKRVERDLSNEVTQYVFSLALRERLRPSRYSREL